MYPGCQTAYLQHLRNSEEHYVETHRSLKGMLNLKTLHVSRFSKGRIYVISQMAKIINLQF